MPLSNVLSEQIQGCLAYERRRIIEAVAYMNLDAMLGKELRSDLTELTERLKRTRKINKLLIMRIVNSPGS